MKRVDLVAGPPLRVVTRWFLRFTVAIVVFGALLGVTGLIVGQGFPRPLLMAGIFVLFGTMAAALGAGLLGVRQQGREAARGYTTAPTAFINLDTVDDRSGAVLRSAGEPLLTMDEYEARVRALDIED